MFDCVLSPPHPGYDLNYQLPWTEVGTRRLCRFKSWSRFANWTTAAFKIPLLRWRCEKSPARHQSGNILQIRIHFSQLSGFDSSSETSVLTQTLKASKLYTRSFVWKSSDVWIKSISLGFQMLRLLC